MSALEIQYYDYALYPFTIYLLTSKHICSSYCAEGILVC